MTTETTIARPARRAGKPAARPLRVIYADDMKELRDLMGIVLGNEGHTLKTFENGAMAHEVLSLSPASFDLVITDHHMPVMNGLEFVRRIRTLPYTGRIIVFSSELSQGVHDEYMSLRVDRVLAKPVLPGELRTLLAEMFPVL
jgi:two-component system chemotaxis response regulator CheY